MDCYSNGEGVDEDKSMSQNTKNVKKITKDLELLNYSDSEYSMEVTP